MYIKNRLHNKAFSLFLLSKERVLNSKEQTYLDEHIETCSQCKSYFQTHAHLQRDLQSYDQDIPHIRLKQPAPLSEIISSSNRKRKIRKITNLTFSTLKVGLAIVLLGAFIWLLSDLFPTLIPAIRSVTSSPQPTSHSQLVPTSTPIIVDLPTPTFSTTEISTPAPTEEKVTLNCNELGSYTKCWDETLNIEFEYPTSWGEIETWMLPGFSGYRYDYWFGGETTLAEAEPLLAGGRSRDYDGRRGGMPTDFWGFSLTEDRCNEVKDQYPVCQVIKPDVVWMERFPNAEDFCYRISAEEFPQTKWQPIVRIEVNLPNNPSIQGFVFEAPFLSNQLSELLNNDLLPFISLGSATRIRNCSASNMQSFDTQVQAYIERVKAKDLDEATLQNLDELLHLANSITFQRTEVITYIVKSGDTIFEIANKFNLKPETILWSNDETLVDNNVVLQPGMELNILPVDGVFYKWKVGDDLNEVASKLGVRTEDIIDWPGNHLNLETLGALSRPKIEPGTMLVIPGGHLDFVSWSSPSPVHAPTIIAQTGVEAFYDILFVIPVGESSLQYFGSQKINGPNAIAVLPDGSFVIADLVGNRVWGYDPTGQVINTIDLSSMDIKQITDLRANSTELIILEEWGERYRVHRLSFDGELLASYDIPKGFHLEDGLTGIAVDCIGDILLEMEGGSRLYRLVDAQGNLEAPIIKTDYLCNGKTYRIATAGPFSTPQLIAGNITLETDLTTGLGGLNLLNVLNDGSFFVVRDDVVKDQVIQVDQTVHYMNADGGQLGVARVPIDQYYYSVMRNLTVGPDGNVYALLPQPNSIDIIRLNFYKNIEALIPGAIEPAITISTINP
jgi:hypothetical protein